MKCRQNSVIPAQLEFLYPFYLQLSNYDSILGFEIFPKVYFPIVLASEDMAQFAPVSPHSNYERFTTIEK
jgi:hypothetical protein